MDEQPIGNLLREKRASLGLSIDQVAGATHIPSQFLEALENEEFDVIPGEGYVKGFLRTYGDYLELDPDPIIDMYNTRHGNGMGPRPLFPWSHGSGASKDSIARLRWRLLPTTATERRENLIVWVLICATLVAIWALYYYLVVRVANLSIEIDTSSLFDGSRCVARHAAASLIAAARSMLC